MRELTEGAAARALDDAFDVRTGGRWSTLQSLKNALLFALIRLGLAIADRLPERVLALMLRGLAAIVFVLAADLRQRARAELRACLTAGAAPSTRRCFRELARSLAESLLLRRSHVAALDLVHVSDEDRLALARALEGGRGAIVASAHLGPFELVPAAVAELGMRPAVVVRESYDPRLNPLVDAHRLERGIRVIHRGDSRAGLQILRALRDGCPLGVLPDVPGRVPSLEVRFLGGRRRLALGPARLCLRTGAPLLVATLGPRRAGDPPRARYRLRVRPVDAQGTEAEITQRISEAIGGAVAAMPAGFAWMA